MAERDDGLWKSSFERGAFRQEIKGLEKPQSPESHSCNLQFYKNKALSCSMPSWIFAITDIDHVMGQTSNSMARRGRPTTASPAALAFKMGATPARQACLPYGIFGRGERLHVYNSTKDRKEGGRLLLIRKPGKTLTALTPTSWRRALRTPRFGDTRRDKRPIASSRRWIFRACHQGCHRAQDQTGQRKWSIPPASSKRIHF